MYIFQPPSGHFIGLIYTGMEMYGMVYFPEFKNHGVNIYNIYILQVTLSMGIPGLSVES